VSVYRTAQAEVDALDDRTCGGTLCARWLNGEARTRHWTTVTTHAEWADQFGCGRLHPCMYREAHLLRHLRDCVRAADGVVSTMSDLGSATWRRSSSTDVEQAGFDSLVIDAAS